MKSGRISLRKVTDLTNSSFRVGMHCTFIGWVAIHCTFIAVWQFIAHLLDVWLIRVLCSNILNFTHSVGCTVNNTVLSHIFIPLNHVKILYSE